MVLTVEKIKKTFQNKMVLKEVSFHLEEGEIVGLIGKNGAGKSTLMKILVGLMKETDGTVSINETQYKDNPEKFLSHVGAVVDTAFFDPNLTGREMLIYFAKMRNVSIADCQLLLEKVGLSEAAMVRVKKYSLGMRQRLGIAQALLVSPKLLILDEPFNGLDVEGVQDLRELLLQLKQEKASILISSHDLSELDRICDRALFLSDGIIVRNLSFDEEKTQVKLKLTTSNDESAYKFIHKMYEELAPVIENRKLFILKTSPAQLAKLIIALQEHEIEVTDYSEVSTKLEEVYEKTISGGMSS